jgi:hypothetical protein
MQQMERDNMSDEKESPERIERDERKSPQTSRIDQELEHPSPPFLNEGPEMVRSSHC